MLSKSKISERTRSGQGPIKLSRVEKDTERGSEAELGVEMEEVQRSSSSS